VVEEGVEGLVAEGAFVAVGVEGVSWGVGIGRGGEVQGIAEETEGEDCEGEGVAGSEGVAVEEAGEGFVVVFCGLVGGC
jgi:hypothetical protein